MSEARLVITAVVVEGRSQAQVARDYGLSEGWVSRLVARYRAEGDIAFEPRSRSPKTRPRATPHDVVQIVIGIRTDLAAAGLDAGADTVRWHLSNRHGIELSRATIYRITRRHDLVVAEPSKKPRSSYIRFQAEQPNETWQADVTHWHHTEDPVEIRGELHYEIHGPTDRRPPKLSVTRIDVFLWSCVLSI